MDANNKLLQLMVGYNPLRLVGETFLYIQPRKQGELSMRGVYQIAHETYGVLGRAQVITAEMKELGDLRTFEMILTAGNVGLINQYRDKGYMWKDEIGVYTLRFTSRKQAFSNLIIQETKRAGIPLTLQQQMF